MARSRRRASRNRKGRSTARYRLSDEIYVLLQEKLRSDVLGCHVVANSIEEGLQILSAMEPPPLAGIIEVGDRLYLEIVKIGIPWFLEQTTMSQFKDVAVLNLMVELALEDLISGMLEFVDRHCDGADGSALNPV